MSNPYEEFLCPKKTRAQYPYSYDPLVIHIDQSKGPATKTTWSDRLYQFDSVKYNELCTKHFGDQGQYWNQRNVKHIEAFLQDWYEDKSVALVAVIEYCNQATCYPVWRFDVATGERDAKK